MAEPATAAASAALPLGLLPTFEPIFIAYAALIVMAVIPIYFGSKMSVEEAKSPDSERLSQSDAYWFPIIGSCVLFGFYLLFTYFGKEYINYLLTGYFAAFGCISLSKLYTAIATTFLPERLYLFDYYRLLVERKRDGVICDWKITWVHGLMAILSAATTAYYVITKNWIASNVFGEAFAISAISLIQLDTFSTGMILLAGLFVYDIFWVFGTDVMVSVAKSFDAPVKILFPRNILAEPNAQFTMLGLGDIVIPGVFVALCLKFDLHLKQTKKGGVQGYPYFTTAIVFYILGLFTTMVVMHTYKAAQPALLYLSPAGILSVLLTALARRELKEVFTFTTEPTPIKDKESDIEDEDLGTEDEEDDEGEQSDVEDEGRKANSKANINVNTNPKPTVVIGKSASSGSPRKRVVYGTNAK